MKVKELIEKITGVSSFGIYTKGHEPLVVHADAKTILSYLERTVDTFSVWIYDEPAEDIFGKKFNAKKIRCCIYLED